MPAGLLLDGSDADLVAAATLASLSPASMSARYVVFDLDGGGKALVSDCIDTVVAVGLVDAGIAMVDYDDAEANVVAVGKRVVGIVDRHQAHGLLAALPPRPVTETSSPAEALFVATSEAAATRLLERLVLLERHDALVSTVSATPGGQPRTAVRVMSPPWWLLSRVIDGDEVGVTAFLTPPPPITTSSKASAPKTTAPSSSGPAALYVQAGIRVPLANVLERGLNQRHELGLYWRDGTFERIAAPLNELPILSTLAPTLPPATSLLTSSSPPEASFTVQLRLAPTGESGDEPELFVVEAERLGALSAFAEAARPEELDRVVLGRLGDVRGRPRYVVRELVRGAEPRLGARLQSLLERPGYVRVPGVEGLYVPPGRRLSPAVRDKELRALLGLSAVDGAEAAAAVVVDEDSDGLTIMTVSRLDDRPLRELSSYRLTDRRVAYDRLYEDAVLAYPDVELPRVTRPSARQTPRVEETERVREVKKPAPPPPTTTMSTPSVVDDDDARVALVAEEAALQAVAVDDLENQAVWTRLAQVKTSLKRDDAIETAANAAFLAGSTSTVELTSLSPPGPPLLELVLSEQLTHATALRLCLELVRFLKAPDARHEAHLKDDIVQQATRKLLDENLPAPLRLRWVALHQIALGLDDPIGLTRAKEALLGSLNTRGLSEALDVPRFVRTALAFSGHDADTQASEAGRSRQEQLVLLERTLHLLVPEPLEVSDGRGALLKAIWAGGFAKLGGQARYIVAAIDVELPLHDPPVQALLRLYQARASYASGRDVDADAWRDEVQRTMGAIERPEDRRVAEWLMKRSAWLRHKDIAPAVTGLRPSLRKIVNAAKDAGSGIADVAAVMGDVRAVSGAYDFEVAAAFEELLVLALRTGRDDVIEAATLEARVAAPSIRILSHRARLLGATVRAAAAINAATVIEDCLDDVATIARDKSVPSVNDLLSAIRPALSALRKVGASDSARRFLMAFQPLASSLPKETGPLSAALAEGFLQLGDVDNANAMLEHALQRVWLPSTPHIDRYEAAVAVVGALVHWPADQRYRLVERFVAQLGMFSDTFTTSHYFPTHQILLAERLIDTIVDDNTARSDHLQRWLDDDEARVRRRIIADWRVMTSRG